MVIIWLQLQLCLNMQKSWKTPKRQSKSVNRRRTRHRNGQKKEDKQPSTKHAHKTKDRVTRTPLKSGGELK